MGHDGRELPSREKEENGIAQQEELEALEAIYGDDFEVVNPGSAASCTEVRLCLLYTRRTCLLFASLL